MSTFVVAVGTIDGEVKTNQVGDERTPVANFRIATNPGWFSVAAWRDLASKVPPTGTPIIVTGKLSTRKYENKDGVTVYVTEVVASTIEVLGTAAQEAPSGATATAGESDLFGD